MASGYSKWYKRKILYRIPKLYKVCPAGNYHLFWDRLCFCRINEHCGSWHGGIYDLKTGVELQYCSYCNPGNTEKYIRRWRLISQFRLARNRHICGR